MPPYSAELINQPIDQFNLKFPLTKCNKYLFVLIISEVFEKWIANQGTSVFLKSKFILTPQGFDKTGLLRNNQSFTTKNFEMTIDFEVSNHKKSPLANGAMQIFFLENSPEKSSHEFAKALNLNFHGLLIEIKENVVRKQLQGMSSPQRMHEISAIYNDKEGNQINNQRSSMCKYGFLDASLRIYSRDGMVTVFVKDKINDSEYTECFKVQADLSFEKYFFISALSGKAISNFHYISSIFTVDLDSQIEKQEYELKQKRIKDSDFVRKGEDILHAKAGHFSSLNKTKQGYNIQIIRYNNIFTRLMANFILNKESQLEILGSLPKDITVLQMTNTLMEQSAKLLQLEVVYNYSWALINKKMNILDNQKQIQQRNDKLERFGVEQQKIEGALVDVASTLIAFENQMKKDKLTAMIEQRRQTIEERSQTGEIDYEALHRIEKSLYKHINEKIERSHGDIKNQLGQDDLMDYVLMIVLLGVAVVGFQMWRKLKEQEKSYIL
ncbi:UNKNOWN [Stylonychia lemnae]|uniref:L-type lectin-like domain-containing protein n=1 Tax=Stylonychia lemnae TaxID=5949 RepID=A0A077ZUN1_STYLE|nr:UNKNOWN [Stylonychia lemnae]|eukprot:CDW73613.1 UNKNOWN [Stylonychia lemnae]